MDKRGFWSCFTYMRVLGWLLDMYFGSFYQKKAWSLGGNLETLSHLGLQLDFQCPMSLAWIRGVNNPFSIFNSQGFFYLGLLADYNLQLVLTPNCLTSSSQAIRFQFTLSSSCRTNTPKHKTGQGSCNQHIDKMKKSGEPGL
jgi:hypothetical protein